jgi:hypothetical protein
MMTPENDRIPAAAGSADAESMEGVTADDEANRCNSLFRVVLFPVNQLGFPCFGRSGNFNATH